MPASYQAEYNRSQNRPQIVAIQKSAIEQAIFTLKSEVSYSDVPELETHLRIAWTQDGRIRYDLCNDKWEQVEIRPSEDGKSGVRIIDSKTMVKEINAWKESNYDPTKKPVLFRRYDVNAQIFAHNYFVCFDNVDEVSDSLSNMICSVVNGMAVQFRKLYTSHEIVHLNLKCCVAVTSIRRVVMLCGIY